MEKLAQGAQRDVDVNTRPRERTGLKTRHYKRKTASGSGVLGGRERKGGVEAKVGAVEEGREFGETEGEAFGGGGAEGDVTEFATRAGRLAVEMEVGVGDGEHFGGFGDFADEIEHGGMAGESRGAEGHAEDGAKMIFELAGDRAFDGPVARIVDARGHFIGEEVAIVFKELDGENTDIFEGFEDLAGGVFGGALNGRFEAGSGRQRKPENAAAMVVFDERIDGRFAGAGAHRLLVR